MSTYNIDILIYIYISPKIQVSNANVVEDLTKSPTSVLNNWLFNNQIN
jgi:hypothetical protein